MKWVTIAQFLYPYEAYIARARLEEAGIPTFLADEHTISTHWIYSQAMGGIRLQVSPEHENSARQLLEDAAPVTALDNVFSQHACPHCGSGECHPAFRLSVLAEMSYLLISWPQPSPISGLECGDCGFFWEESEAAENS
ncbi:DUF2007 domain-containing protein [Pokkaliibacter sp. CJK22405]|uniref:putative signal transducing protein n=1 Tax=Pokkaliibacter sp. CJK22405 TaxID=3384615 RepID=UPI003984C347